VRRVVLLGGRGERPEVGAVDLVALHQAHVLEAGCDGLDRVEDVPEHRDVRSDELRPRRPVLVGGVEDVGHVGEVAQRVSGALRVEQVDGAVPDDAAVRSAAS
jgi:hypothetical protein